MQEEIEIPKGISAEVSEYTVTISNNKGTLERTFKASEITFEKTNDLILIKTANKDKKTQAILNTIRSIIVNMFKGLTEGFEYKLAIVFSHFPITVTKKGDFMEINNFLGEKKPIKSKVIGKTDVLVKGKEIVVKGMDKIAAGQTAANLERSTRVKGRDKRIFQDGIYIVSKPK